MDMIMLKNTSDFSLQQSQISSEFDQELLQITGETFRALMQEGPSFFVLT